MNSLIASLDRMRPLIQMVLEDHPELAYEKPEDFVLDAVRSRIVELNSLSVKKAR